MSPSDNVFTMIRLPAGAGFSGITGVSGGAPTCTFTSPDVACQHAALAGGGEIVFDVAVVLPTRLPGGGTLQTQAEVDPKNAVPEGDETNNKAQLSIAVQP
jgi:hypothetical protein